MEVILAMIGVLLIGLFIVIILILRKQNKTPNDNVNLENYMAEITGRLKTLSESGNILSQNLNTQIETLRGSIDQKMTQNSENTKKSLTDIHTRLAIIDRAEKNIQTLSTHIGDLQKILSDKQLRGAFGESRMEAIIRDGLPADSYQFQATLSNGKRPDCVIYLSAKKGNTQKIVIDAKFPLEAFRSLRDAQNTQERENAMRQVKKTTGEHIKKISESYIIPGETYDPILMFIPSESIFAELYDSFEEIFQQAYRAGVAVISPNIMMLAIQTLQTILKDEKMRNQAGLIKNEVGLLLKDVDRLQERTKKLETHFRQTSNDIDSILISTKKITDRGEKIGHVELEKTHQEKMQIEN